MRAVVITGPGQAEVVDVPAPIVEPGHVVVEVSRAGVCGTDVEMFTGEMAYLQAGISTYPIQIGHEWCGVVREAGPGVSPELVGARVTGDTMLGCQVCYRCRSGRQHVCANRSELGIMGRYPGAVAEQILVPATSLHLLPDSVDDTAGAMVEPGGNSLRAVWGVAPKPGERVLVTGAATIGLLCALFARSLGAEVHVLGRSSRSREFASNIGLANVWTAETLPDLPFDAVIEASNSPDLPSFALDRVEYGGRVAFVGLAGVETPVDTRTIALKDVTAAGILSASPGLAATVEAYGNGSVDPRPLVAATVGLDDVAAVLRGERPAGAGAGPKIQIDPTR